LIFLDAALHFATIRAALPFNTAAGPRVQHVETHFSKNPSSPWPWVSLARKNMHGTLYTALPTHGLRQAQ